MLIWCVVFPVARPHSGSLPPGEEEARDAGSPLLLLRVQSCPFVVRKAGETRAPQLSRPGSCSQSPLDITRRLFFDRRNADFPVDGSRRFGNRRYEPQFFALVKGPFLILNPGDWNQPSHLQPRNRARRSRAPDGRRRAASRTSAVCAPRTFCSIAPAMRSPKASCMEQSFSVPGPLAPLNRGRSGR